MHANPGGGSVWGGGLHEHRLCRGRADRHTIVVRVCRAWHDAPLISSSCLIISSLQSELCVCAHNRVQTGRLPPFVAGMWSSQCACMVVAVLFSLLQRLRVRLVRGAKLLWTRSLRAWPRAGLATGWGIQQALWRVCACCCYSPFRVLLCAGVVCVCVCVLLAPSRCCVLHRGMVCADVVGGCRVGAELCSTQPRHTPTCYCCCH